MLLIMGCALCLGLGLNPSRAQAQAQSEDAHAQDPSSTPAPPANSSQAANSNQAAPAYVPGEVIVKLKSSTGQGQAQLFMAKTAAQKGLALRRSWSGLNMHRFSAKAGTKVDVPSLVNQLKSDPDVEYAEPNYYVSTQQLTSTQSNSGQNEALGIQPVRLSAGEIQSLNVSTSSFVQSEANIQASEAWDQMSAAGTPTVVAIIDTGVDVDHYIFVQSQAIWINADEVAGNGIDDDGNGYIDDINGWNFVGNNNQPLDDDGHGTHVAGIVLGVTQNIAAYPLSQARIRLMALKFLDANGVGTTSDAIEAIYYAANNGAHVLSNSWGGGGYSQGLAEAINYVYSKKLVFVAAAGNSAANNDQKPMYPANYPIPNIVSVAATNDFDRLAGFSNFGANSVHIGSPGVAILSTLPDDSFGYASGTSMATPFVSGVAALMVRESPLMNGYQIRNILLGSIDSAPLLQGKVKTAGRLNVLHSVQKAQTEPVDPYLPTGDSSSVGSTRAPAAAMGGGCGMVAQNYWNRQGGGPNQPPGQAPGTLSLLLISLVFVAPLLLWLEMRRRAQGKHQRRHERYQIDSRVKVRVGDRELIGQVSSISLGGVQLNTDAWLDQGGIVNMQIMSPDGRDVIQVEGKVVWSEEHKRYGVAFQNAEDSVRSTISRWTGGLIKNVA